MKISDESGISLTKNSAVVAAIFGEQIIQHVLYRIFSFMFNLCHMPSQDGSLMGLQV